MIEKDAFRINPQSEAKRIEDALINRSNSSVKVEAEVKPANGGQIAKIRNLFSPILNFFTMDAELNKIGLSVQKDERKIIAELTKNMIKEKKLIRQNKNAEQIKTLLDELG